MLGYITAVGVGLDILTNAITGGRPYQTLSCRIGISIQSGGLASYIPWPRVVRNHFISSVFETIV